MNKRIGIGFAGAAVVAAILYSEAGLHASFLVESLGKLGTVGAAALSLGSLAVVVAAVYLARRRHRAEGGPGGSRAWVPRVAAAALGTFVGIGGAAAGWHLYGSSALSAEANAIQQAGLAVEKPRNRPLPPPEANAAVDLKKGFEWLRGSPTPVGAPAGQKSGLDEVSTTYTRFLQGEAGIADLRALRVSERYAPAVESCLAASKKPESSWGVDYERPFWEVELPVLSPAMHLARVIGIRAILEAADGRVDAAVASVRAGLAMGKSVANEPTLISQMIGIAIVGIVLRAAECAFPSGPPPSAEGAWAPVLDDQPMEDGFRQTIRYEMQGIPLEIARHPFRGSAEMGIGSRANFVPWLYTPFMRLDAAKVLRGNRETLRLFEAPYDKGWRDRVYAARTAAEKGQMLMGSVVTPRFEAMRPKHMVGIARLRVARAVLASRSKSDGAKEMPRDPFGGEALKVKVAGPITWIYSVGPDLSDEGGVAYDTKSEKGDIAWKVTAASAPKK